MEGIVDRAYREMHEEFIQDKREILAGLRLVAGGDTHYGSKRIARDAIRFIEKWGTNEQF